MHPLFTRRKNESKSNQMTFDLHFENPKMKRSGSPNAFEERLTKLIYDRAEVAESTKVENMKNELELTNERLMQAEKEIDAYQSQISDMRDSVASHMRELEDLIGDDYDCPDNPLQNFCCYCNHHLSVSQSRESKCSGSKCRWVIKDLPCREWCLKRKDATQKYYTCSTKQCPLRVCGTHCTVCRVCENKKK